MAASGLLFKTFLGKGSYGSVSLFEYVEPRTAHRYTAVKTSDAEHASALYKEFHILSRLKGSSRIVQCIENMVLECDDGEGNTDYMLLLEYASGGSLKDFMNTFKDGKLPDALIREFTRMLLEGLATIHEQGLVHCDLKPDNILVFPKRVFKNNQLRWTFELKISDFGLAQRDGDNQWWSLRRRFAGTPIYMSPESVSHGETTRGLDLWSLGCVVLEMYTGKRPWWHKQDFFKDLKQCYEPLVPNDLPTDAKFFLMTCFAPEVDDRKDAVTLLRHYFLSRYSSELRGPLVNVKDHALMQTGLKLEKLNRIAGNVRVLV